MNTLDSRFNLVAVILTTGLAALVLGTRTLSAGERLASTEQATPTQTAVVSDLGPESTAEVAREILRLQQQLGGSVVQDRPQLQSFPTETYPPPRYQSPRDTTLLTWPEEQALATDRSVRHSQHFQNQSPRARVSQLRETALLLDTKAHHLEELDLYEQADALRDLATRLRRDARAMKREASSASADWPQYLAPITPTANSHQK